MALHLRGTVTAELDFVLSVAVPGALANVGAVGGVLSLTGPLNSGNGLIGGIALPLGMWLVWILLASITWLRKPAAVASAG